VFRRREFGSSWTRLSEERGSRKLRVRALTFLASLRRVRRLEGACAGCGVKYRLARGLGASRVALDDGRPTRREENVRALVV